MEFDASSLPKVYINDHFTCSNLIYLGKGLSGGDRQTEEWHPKQDKENKAWVK